MNHATAKTALAASIATLGLTFFSASAQAQTSPDVHVTADRWCSQSSTGENDMTMYEFHLRNLGDQRRRGVRVRVRRETGFSELYAVRVRRGWGDLERVWLAPGERATVTFRSQRRVILWAALVGDCPTKG